jgi:hypothetical protein
VQPGQSHAQHLHCSQPLYCSHIYLKALLTWRHGACHLVEPKSTPPGTTATHWKSRPRPFSESSSPFLFSVFFSLLFLFPREARGDGGHERGPHTYTYSHTGKRTVRIHRSSSDTVALPQCNETVKKTKENTRRRRCHGSLRRRGEPAARSASQRPCHLSGSICKRDAPPPPPSRGVEGREFTRSPPSPVATVDAVFAADTKSGAVVTLGPFPVRSPGRGFALIATGASAMRSVASVDVAGDCAAIACSRP